MTKILGISGSNRVNSYNTSAIRFINEKYKDKIDFKIIDISTLPMFNEDLENDLPTEVINFKNEIEESDGIIISTPEYNFSITPLLKNAIDWASRGEVKILNGKNVAIMSASPSFIGGARAQMELRKICQCLNMNIMYEPVVYITNAYEKIDNGIINDTYTQNKIVEMVDAFLKVIN